MAKTKQHNVQESESSSNQLGGSLVDFVASVSGESTVRVEESLGDGFVRLRVSEAERRQAKHDIRCVEDAVIEMLRNSRDAGAHTIFVATSREGDARTIVMLDDGIGVPESMRERIFDARVTSKLDTVHMDRWGVHGRGMALFSIKQNVKRAEVMTSGKNLGSSIRVDADATKLTERKDQSTWPTMAHSEEDSLALKGPHNIIRTCCEFALEERGGVEVYLGSAAEILATARVLAEGSVDASKLLFTTDKESLPVVMRPALAGDAHELSEIAESLGLSISERTAHRILSGQIKPLRPVAARLLHHAGKPGTTEVDLLRDRRGLKISKEDLEQFSRMLERDFDYLGERYYINLSTEPRISVTKDKITVSFTLEKGD